MKRKKLDPEEQFAKRRTLLSKKRTFLSMERTFLSYVRTAFTVFLFGVAVIRLFDFNQIAIYIGVASIFFGAFIFVVGLIATINRSKKFRRL